MLSDSSIDYTGSHTHNAGNQTCKKNPNFSVETKVKNRNYVFDLRHMYSEFLDRKRIFQVNCIPFIQTHFIFFLEVVKKF